MSRTVQAILGMVAAGGLGLGLWVAMASNETQMKERAAKELPRSIPQQQSERQRINAEVMKTIKEAAETNQNVVWRTSQKPK